MASGSSYMLHQSGFTAPSLKRFLQRAGFEACGVRRHVETLELLSHAMKRAEGNLFVGLNAYLKTLQRG